MLTLVPPAAPGAIRVWLQLSSLLWNQLLAAALNQVPGIQAGAGLEGAFDGVGRRGPAGVLLTSTPTNRLGWERLAQWCRRGGAGAPRVLVMGENRSAVAARALRLGACGYVDGESPLPALIKAIRGVHAGELWAERRVAWSLLRGEEGVSAGGAAAQLTRREVHVLEALAEGRRNKEIAELLTISETTVKSHLNRAFHKLHLSDRLQAALYVERHGLEAGTRTPEADRSGGS